MTRQLAERLAFRTVAPVTVVFLAVVGVVAASIDYPLERGVWLLRALGYGAAAMLALSLLATPARVVLSRVRSASGDASVLHAYRRACGIAAAVLATIHLAVALATYLHGSWASIFYQPFLRAGALALLILWVLLLTSFPALVRLARVKLWKHLHRLVYVVALLVFQHVLQAPFGFRWWTIGIALALAALMAVRLLPARRKPTGRVRAGTGAVGEGPNPTYARSGSSPRERAHRRTMKSCADFTDSCLTRSMSAS